MTNQEAIEILRERAGSTTEETFTEAVELATEALEKQEKYEAQWLNDMGNPLEPLKLSSALDAEIFKMEYRKEHKPKDITMLDYTIIAALKECLERRTGGTL